MAVTCFVHEARPSPAPSWPCTRSSQADTVSATFWESGPGIAEHRGESKDPSPAGMFRVSRHPECDGVDGMKSVCCLESLFKKQRKLFMARPLALSGLCCLSLSPASQSDTILQRTS